jgi:two-component system catabolic regulation response regulator CreB
MAILVVEDDADVRHCVSFILRLEGFVVDAVGDGREAMAYLSAHPAPSLMILDLGLPKIDGATLRKRMLKNPKLAEIPVVILSSQASAAKQLPGCEFVAKPFSIEELIHVVQNRAVTVPRGEHFLRGVLRGEH